MRTIIESTKIQFVRLCIFAIVVLIPLAAKAEYAQPSGSGTSSDPYELATADHLYWFADQVNTGKNRICAVMIADIVVNTSVLDADGNLNGDGSDFRLWIPIVGASGYNGTFDGQGYIISGLYVNNETERIAGLFGYIRESCLITNLAIRDCYIYSGGEPSLDGGVGGICGYSRGGKIENCYNLGTVIGEESVGGICGATEGGEITNCYNTGQIVGESLVGGVCGSCNNRFDTTIISNCYNTGHIAGENGAGGVCGKMMFTIMRECFNIGSVSIVQGNCGGIGGYIGNSSISGCFNIGSVSIVQGNCGGIGGYTWASSNFSNCYYLGETCPEGAKSWEGCILKTHDQFASGEVAWLLNNYNKDDSVSWYQKLGANGNEHPVLTSKGDDLVYRGYPQDATCGSEYIYSNEPIGQTKPNHTEYDDNGFCKKCGRGFQPAMLVSQDNYEISNAGQLYWFSDQVNSGDTGICAVLTSDIVVNENVLDTEGNLNGDGSWFRTWIPIGLNIADACYTGTFDGQDHTISGLYVNDENLFSVGLFGSIKSTGVIKNIGIINSYIHAYGNVGGVCGRNTSGIITNCYNTGSVTGLSDLVGGVCGRNTSGIITDCYNTGSVTGLSDLVGGVCGYNTSGIITDCYNTGSVTGLSDLVGGVCGYNRGKITDCYNTGSVTGLLDYVGGVCGYNVFTYNIFEISNSYNTGPVTGSSNVGGLCGRSEDLIFHCYNRGFVTGVSNVGGVCGEMEGYSRFECYIANCYSSGFISGDEHIGGICGNNVKEYGSIDHCYILKGSLIDGVESGTGEVIEKTTNDFAHGEVAWLLNGSEAGENPVWRQSIGEDEFPVLDAAHGIVLEAISTGLNTIARPTAGELKGAEKVYNFAGILGTDVYGLEYTEPLLAARHPYVFTTEQEYVSFVPSDEDVTDNTETFGLTGVLDAAGRTVYGNAGPDSEPVSVVFTSDALVFASLEGQLVKYGECFILADEAMLADVPAQAEKLPVVFTDGHTGLDRLDGSETAARYYNLLGVEVGDDYHGILIYNGKKLMRK